MREALPQSLKRGLREGVQSVGTATSALRALPDFLVLGTQKGGTTALYAYLLAHPGIGGPASKEVEFFSRFYARGNAWYRGHFPFTVRRLVTGEASPDYLPHPLVARRARALLPEAKLIVLLRDPVDRALSSWAHEVASGRETLPFREALEREAERTAGELERMETDPAYYSFAWRYHSYLGRGLYADQLERWFAAYPREQFLILGSEQDLFDDPAGTYARVLAFVGAKPHSLDAYPAVLAREYEAMEESTRSFLVDYFREPNERLTALLGRDFGWR